MVVGRYWGLLGRLGSPSLVSTCFYDLTTLAQPDEESLSLQFISLHGQLSIPAGERSKSRSLPGDSYVVSFWL